MKTGFKPSPRLGKKSLSPKKEQNCFGLWSPATFERQALANGFVSTRQNYSPACPAVPSVGKTAGTSQGQAELHYFAATRHSG